jgi:hypothetical protein
MRSVGATVFVCLAVLVSAPAFTAGAAPRATTPIPPWVPVVIDHPTPDTGSLPTDLWLGGTGHGPVITPAQAQLVLDSVWFLRFQAFHDQDRGAMVMFETGPALESDEVTCGCNYRVVRPNITRDSLLVPRQLHFPATFLAEATTTLSGAPYTQYLVISRTSAATPWMVVADPGDQGAQVLDRPQATRGGFDAPGDPRPSSRRLPAELAGYWQTWTDTGQAPRLSVFAPGSDTTKQGALLAKAPQGALASFNGLIGSYRYRAGGSDERWSFATATGVLTCGVVRFQSTWSNLGGVDWQPNAESNWGSTVPPGVYKDVVSTDIAQPCFIQRPGAAVEVTSGIMDPDTVQGQGLGATPPPYGSPAAA